jgi:ParB/RepB/Spo0J family partition protein
VSQSVEATAPDPSSLPDEDYTLVHISKLVHGEHNPRRVQPKRTLKQSIEGSGINRPLIVRPAPDEEVYHITDGWQRYQAAIDAGWEQLPVKICDSTLEALDRTKLDSAGCREWSPYDWAQFCRSMAKEIQTKEDSKMDIARRVADAVDLTPNTVRRYLNVLSLPQVIHPLLTVGPDGSETEWSHLQGYNEDVRQYKGLRLQVADRLATLQSSVSSDERLIAIAATAVEFTEPEDAIEFIELAVENDEQRLDMVRREVLVGSDHNQYLIVPRVAVELTTEQKQALMEYCHQHRQSLSEIVTEEITALASDIGDGDTDDDIERSVGTGDDDQIEC